MDIPGYSDVRVQSEACHMCVVTPVGWRMASCLGPVRLLDTLPLARDSHKDTVVAPSAFGTYPYCISLAIR